MKTISRHTKYIGIVTVAVVCTVLVIFAFTPNNNSSLSPTSSSTVSSTIPASSTGQSVDSGLSLGPTTTNNGTGASPSPAPVVKPTAAQTGCRMELDFNIVSAPTANGTASYKLAAKNLGGSACTTASISVYYGTNESFNAASPQATADGYYWVLGSLAAGQEYDIALTTNWTGATSAASTNEACLSAVNGTDACANAGATSGTPSPSLAGAGANTVSQDLSSITNTAGPTPTPASAPLVTSYAPASGQEFGVWEWTTVSQMSPTDMQNIVNEASVNHFNVIYLTVDDYLTLAAMPAGDAKTQALANYNSALESFLTMAKAKGIAVDAESGAKDWAQQQNVTNAPRIMTFVAAFNQTNSVKFRGVQYDIEPYLLDQYNTDPTTVLTQYVSLVDTLVQQDKYANLPLTMVEPHFFDSGIKWTPQVTVDGVTNYPFEQVVRLLNELPAGNGRAIVMAYRNFATGSDGSIALSSQEVTDANATNVKVIVAQETGPVTPSYVTFNGESRAALFGQITLINQAYASSKSFAGTAVDYLVPFLNLQ